MNLYSEVAHALDFPQAIKACMEGRILCPMESFTAPVAWYGFPPALIPIWSDGSSPKYMGYWKHWFVDRDPSFVKMYVAAGRAVVEIGRTPKQFFSSCLISGIVEKDGVTNREREFAEAVGIENLGELDSLSLETGDDPKGYFRLAEFRDALPLESVTDYASYSGEFPTPQFESTRRWWEKACSFEVTEEISALWPTEVEMPQWLNGRIPKSILFKRFFAEKRYDCAWLTLNSNGWRIDEARIAAQSLQNISGDPGFRKLIQAWLRIADNSAGGY